MIKTHITPKQANISINLPESYVDKPLEIWIYNMEEAMVTNKNEAPAMAAFRGLLTPEEANLLQQEVKKSREEWDNNI